MLRSIRTLRSIPRIKDITLVPAKTLGLEGEVGSVSVGKAADLLLFSGDPLDPASKLLRVWHKGHTVDASDDAKGGSR